MSFHGKSNRTLKDKNIETVTVLKLLNSYADSYKILDKENKSLKQYISDLKTNLKVSKQIIDTFISKNSETKYKTIILNLQNENKTNSKINEELTKKNFSLEKELNKLNQIITKLNEEIEDLKTKKFLLEQSLIKKNNIIMSHSKAFQKSQFIVLNPNKAIVRMNDELLTYKSINETFSKNLKQNNEKISKYQSLIATLELEKDQLKTQNKIQLLSVNREKENLKYKLKSTINTLKEDKSYRSNNTPKIGNINLKNFQLNSNNNKLKSKLQMESIDRSNKSIEENEFSKNSFEINGVNNEEFKEVLKQAGISNEAYILLSSNRLYSKLTDAIELMFKLVIDKNMTIKILETENENLNKKNSELNDENMSILSKINNDSMLNNTSKITINNLNINSLRAYKKILNKNNNITSSNSNTNSNSSKEDTESIVDMKTKQNIIKKFILDKKNKSSEFRRNDENFLSLESSISSSEFRKDCKIFNSFASSIINIDEGK